MENSLPARSLRALEWNKPSAPATRDEGTGAAADSTRYQRHSASARAEPGLLLHGLGHDSDHLRRARGDPGHLYLYRRRLRAQNRGRYWRRTGVRRAGRAGGNAWFRFDAWREGTRRNIEHPGIGREA